MAIATEARVCPYCRKSQGMSLWIAAIVILLGLAFVSGITEDAKDNIVKKDKLKPFLYKCLESYPNDAGFCVEEALRYKYSMDEIQVVLNQHSIDYPEISKKHRKPAR